MLDSRWLECYANSMKAAKCPWHAIGIGVSADGGCAHRAFQAFTIWLAL